MSETSGVSGSSERKPTAAARVQAAKEKGEAEVLAAIREMSEPDHEMAERLHALVMAAAPDLVPRLWYGMPAYAKNGKVVCFFQAAQKFKTRYATFGFQDEAHLDEGRMWPVAFALTGLGPAEEAKVTDLVKRAVG